MNYINLHFVLAILILGFIFFPGVAAARTTPEDIFNAKKETYNKTIVSYSSSNKQKLDQLAQKISQINKTRTDELDQIMVTQAVILDEYEERSDGKNVEEIKKSRYWITYAHEAVAYQAAKNYVFELNGEGRIKGDALSTVNLFQSELNSTRAKVIKSQKILEGVVR